MPRKPSKKKIENRVNDLYAKFCSGITIGIFDIGKVMDVGVEACEAGDDDDAVGAKLKAFALSIAK